jgi:glycyl-tRNA synthetase beta subunit
MKMETHLSEPLGYSKGSVKRKVYIYKHLYLKKNRIQIHRLMMYPKLLEKEQVKPQIIRWKEIIKARAEIDEIQI